jgi:hypothetical protein
MSHFVNLGLKCEKIIVLFGSGGAKIGYSAFWRPKNVMIVVCMISSPLSSFVKYQPRFSDKVSVYNSPENSHMREV